MPGIFGLIQPGINVELESRIVHGMMRALCHYPWYRRSLQRAAGTTLGTIDLGVLPHAPRSVTSDDGRLLLTFAGEIYNAGELHHELGLHRHVPADDQSLIMMHAVRRWGADALARCNGIFQVACWDTQQRELILGGDAAGLRPIYYALHGEHFAFAAEVKALLALPWLARALDMRGIASFLQLGLLVEDRTFFEGVRIVPPGHCAIFRNGMLRFVKHGEVQFGEYSKHSEEEMAERLATDWREVISRQSREKSSAGVLISGGLDSRMILAGLAANGKQVKTFTMGPPDCEDVRIAAQAAAIANFHNQLVAVKAEEIADGLEAAVYLTDGIYNCFHASIRLLLPALAPQVEVVFDGMSPMDSLYDPEDLLMQKLTRQRYRLAWLEKKIGLIDLNNYVLNGGNQRSLLASDWRRPFGALPASELLSGFLNESADKHSVATMLDAFWVGRWQPRFSTFGAQLLRSRVEVRCPFFDHAILKLLADTTPLQRSSDKPLQRRAIGKLYPALARLPWERTDLPLSAGLLRTSQRRVTRLVAKKSRNLLARLQRGTRTGGAHGVLMDYNELIRVSPALQHVLRQHLLARWQEGSRLFDKQALSELLTDHLNRRGNHKEMLGRVLTIEMWHKQFAQQQSSASQREVHDKREMRGNQTDWQQAARARGGEKFTAEVEADVHFRSS